MKAELVPENGDPPIPINRDLTVVGRRDYCDVVIDHSSLSKRHCVLVKTDGLLVIRDLMSTNGTKVKGQKIRWAALLPDDRISLGNYKLRVYLGPSDVPGPSEIYRENGGRAISGASSAAGIAGYAAAGNRSGGPASTRPAGQRFGGGFPEPSPLEVPTPALDKDILSSGLPANDREPLIPVSLDNDNDDDEIIDLD